jgi:hypothetical protein
MPTLPWIGIATFLRLCSKIGVAFQKAIALKKGQLLRQLFASASLGTARKDLSHEF